MPVNCITDVLKLLVSWNFLNVAAVSLSGLATYFSYRVMKQTRNDSLIPIASFEFSSDPSGNGNRINGILPTMFANHGNHYCDIVCTVKVESNHSTFAGKGAYGGVTSITLAPKQALSGVFVWDEHAPSTFTDVKALCQKDIAFLNDDAGILISAKVVIKSRANNKIKIELPFQYYRFNPLVGSIEPIFQHSST